MLNLTTLTWVRFAVWLAIGLAVYFAYGRRHSLVGIEAKRVFDQTILDEAIREEDAVRAP